MKDLSARAAELDREAQQKLRLARQLRAEGFRATADFLKAEAARLAEASLDAFHAHHCRRLAA